MLMTVTTYFVKLSSYTLKPDFHVIAPVVSVATVVETMALTTGVTATTVVIAVVRIVHVKFYLGDWSDRSFFATEPIGAIYRNLGF